MNWQALLRKVGKWLLKKGSEELLKEAVKRAEKEVDVHPPPRLRDLPRDANPEYVHHVTRDEWACDACGESFTGPASVVTGTDSGELRTPRRRTRETRR